MPVLLALGVVEDGGIRQPSEMVHEYGFLQGRSRVEDVGHLDLPIPTVILLLAE